MDMNLSLHIKTEVGWIAHHLCFAVEFKYAYTNAESVSVHVISLYRWTKCRWATSTSLHCVSVNYSSTYSIELECAQLECIYF
jgi:hypothetical protein